MSEVIVVITTFGDDGSAIAQHYGPIGPPVVRLIEAFMRGSLVLEQVMSAELIEASMKRDHGVIFDCTEQP